MLRKEKRFCVLMMLFLAIGVPLEMLSQNALTQGEPKIHLIYDVFKVKRKGTIVSDSSVFGFYLNDNSSQISNFTSNSNLDQFMVNDKKAYKFLKKCRFESTCATLFGTLTVISGVLFCVSSIADPQAFSQPSASQPIDEKLIPFSGGLFVGTFVAFIICHEYSGKNFVKSVNYYNSNAGYGVPKSDLIFR
jgi:hypothetical protein